MIYAQNPAMDNDSLVEFFEAIGIHNRLAIENLRWAWMEISGKYLHSIPPLKTQLEQFGFSDTQSTILDPFMVKRKHKLD